MQFDYLNYKEPLKPVPEGYGFLGTLAQTKDRTLVQCHICGNTYENVGHHAWAKHGIKARKYREKFQLGLRTPLCSDAWSEKYKQMKLEMWENMTETQREERREMMRQAQQKAKRVGPKRSLEALNKDGMCPDQLIERIKECADKLGHSPTKTEFEKYYNGKYYGAIVRTFGSWNGGKAMADLPSCKTGSRTPHNKLKYSNEDLLEFLRSFHKEKGYKPTHSDWVKGFLPNYYVYQKRFGGIEKARKLAGIDI